MKRTPMSVARAVGNRKLTFAMIERRRAYECDPTLISEANQKAQGKHMVVPQPSRKKVLTERPDSECYDREISPDVRLPMTSFL